jgi:tyrosyl-tRNA synthetase
LTLLDFDKIEEILKKHNEKPELRYWQTELAKYVITTIFSKESADQAEKISKVMFSNEDKLEIIKSLNNEDKKALLKEVWGVELWNGKILELLTNSGLTTSNSEAKKLIQASWIFLNEQKLEDINYIVNKSNFVNWICLLRKGKKNYKIIIKTSKLNTV